MAEKKRKGEPLEENHPFEAEDRGFSDAPIQSKRRQDAKRIRKVSPLGLRVLVQIRKDPNTTDGGLYLPEGAKQSLQESIVGEVLEVASATDESTDEETNVSGIPLGAIILIPKHAGIRVPWDESLRIVDTKEVLAIVHEISLT